MDAVTAQNLDIVPATSTRELRPCCHFVPAISPAHEEPGIHSCVTPTSESAMGKEVSFQEALRPPDIDLRKYKQRDLSQTLFFKAACRTFGPPKSRTRRIVAPPMPKVESDPLDPPGKSTAASGVTETPGTKGAELNVSDWISERRKLREQLDGMGDLERWLRGKPDLTALETRVRNKMAERRSKSQMSQQTNQDAASSEAERSAFTPSIQPNPEALAILDHYLHQHRLRLVDLHNQTDKRKRKEISSNDLKSVRKEEAEHSVLRSSRHSVVKPSIQQPAPEALAILDRYLHQHRLRLVDLYNQTDKRKRKEISSNDLKSVRKEANIPLSDLQFDNLVISLGNKNPNHMNYKELSVGRHLWWKKNMERHRKGESVCPGTGASVQFLWPSSDQESDSGDTKPSSPLSISLRSGGDTKSRSQPGRSDQSEAGKSQFLQVPPVSLEEMRPLSYDDMEEIGKNYRERKRRAKSNTRLLDWLDQCRLVRTGNAAVDGHSLPSTLGEESADLVERFRRQGLRQYHKILKLCRAYDVPLTEELLEEALLYPGDKLICESGEQLPLRQPGVGLLSKDRFMKKSSATKEPKGRRSVDEDPDRSPGLCRDPYPPNTYVAKVRGRRDSGQRL